MVRTLLTHALAYLLTSYSLTSYSLTHLLLTHSLGQVKQPSCNGSVCCVRCVLTVYSLAPPSLLRPTSAPSTWIRLPSTSSPFTPLLTAKHRYVTGLLTHSLTLLTYSLTHLLTHLLTHSLTHLVNLRSIPWCGSYCRYFPTCGRF